MLNYTVELFNPFLIASKTIRVNTITTLPADAIGLDKMDDEKDFKFRSQIKRRNECWQHFLPLFFTLIWQAALLRQCVCLFLGPETGPAPGFDINQLFYF